jgi:galactose mutarotase-like enzyme
VATVRNAGEEEMPASLGFHPAFLWPLPYGQARESHFLEFEADEPAPGKRIGPDGLLLPGPQPTSIKGRRLDLSDALFREDVLILDALRSRAVTYGSAEGPQLEVKFPDARYLGLWTKPGAPFICIEPWRGISDPAGFEGDFRDKPGVFLVPPGDSRSLTMVVRVLRAS